MWTDTWTNFDPANTIYPTATVTVSANITVDTRWTANNTYLLSGPIYVNNNATLTIEPGTVIRGNKAFAGSALVITKGAKLIANGTKNAPIVFTSSGGVGNRAIGDWGGIVILGKAANNLPANATAGTAAGIGNIEGLPVSPILSTVVAQPPTTTTTAVFLSTSASSLVATPTKLIKKSMA